MEKLSFKISRSISSVFVIVLFIAFAFATDESNDNRSAVQTTDRSIEYKLAVVDGNSTPSDETVRRYGRALDLLERYCPESREEIADMTVRGQEILQEENIDQSLISLLQNFRNSIPEEANSGEVGDCKSIFSSYITLRVQ